TRLFQDHTPRCDVRLTAQPFADLKLDPAALVWHIGRDFADNANIFRAQFLVEEAKGYRAATLDPGDVAGDFLHILRIHILAAHDDQVFLAPDDIQFTVGKVAEIPRDNPTVAERRL